MGSQVVELGKLASIHCFTSFEDLRLQASGRLGEEGNKQTFNVTNVINNNNAR